jgi:hypothetical protein
LPAPLQNFTTYVAVPWPGAAPTSRPRRRRRRAHALAAGAPARSLFVAAGIAPAP